MFEFDNAADLMAWLDSIAMIVPLHKVSVQLVVGHPDYQGPDAEEAAVRADVVMTADGRQIRLYGETVRQP